MQQREIVVLESMPFQALRCKDGALISICMSKALILRVLGWHLLGSTTAIMLPSIPTYGGTWLFIDSHIQRIVFETEGTTVTQQVSHRPIKHYRGHKELRPSTSHNGESPLLKSTGIQFATKSMLGTTNGEHRKLIGVKSTSLFGYEV